ncbi:hypothetical protein HZU40_22540 [Mycolicibacterium fluoranthenivorans]|uniref:Helix-turn-helix domain-containing protein n=1 Tax=Mycolicibacterium fluoranthenivorans TaxID=258505 RepID=A0A7G8P9H8_9MYCO|nr:hypothetical protein [Mycolicibacterium fluoranthenivorans]QNJ90994.1 hypothetical protein HZU40_22540 [Mycolicibacterium fluoranthenivorans]
MEDPVAAAASSAVPHLNTLSEAAAKLRRSKSWLRARIRAGGIETVRLSERSVFVADDEILRYLAAHGWTGSGSAA